MTMTTAYPDPLQPIIANIFREGIALRETMLETGMETILAVAQALILSLGGGRKVLLFGNGGSAADAQHIAAEWVGRFERERKAYPAMALTVNTSALTAIANDYDYSAVFSRQIEAWACQGDVAIGISTSGHSKNVIEGIKMANRLGAVTVGLTGKGGGALAKEADFCIQVPSENTARIQEMHITIGHILCLLTDTALHPS